MRHAKTLVSMHREPDDNEVQVDYPFGLSIRLTNAELEKIGIDPADCKVGQAMHVCCDCEIKYVKREHMQVGDKVVPNHAIELQIMAMGKGKPNDTATEDRRKRAYDKLDIDLGDNDEDD